jgi:hypothetical protein
MELQVFHDFDLANFLHPDSDFLECIVRYLELASSTTCMKEAFSTFHSCICVREGKHMTVGYKSMYEGNLTQSFSKFVARTDVVAWEHI